MIFDLIFVFTQNAAFGQAAFWDIAAGIIGGLLAAIFGFAALPTKRSHASGGSTPG